MTRWVEDESYTGVDRRKGRARLRYAERRQVAAAREAPSLGAALRQLRVRAAAAGTPSGIRAFANRTLAIAGLAEAMNEPALAEELRRLADLVSAQPGLDWRKPLDEALSTISDRLATK